jgi:hypothetical protein
MPSFLLDILFSSNLTLLESVWLAAGTGSIARLLFCFIEISARRPPILIGVG